MTIIAAIDSVRMFADLCLRPSGTPGAVFTSDKRTENDSLYILYRAFTEEFHPNVSRSLRDFVRHLGTVLPSHYVPLELMPPDPSYWVNIEIVDAAFTVDPERTSTRCHPSNCKEGGLDCFTAFRSGTAS